MVYGGVFALFLRYVLHTVAGATVWAGLSIPTQAALAYSLAYNATYMLPETLVTALGTALVCKVLDFRNDTVGRATAKDGRFDWCLLGAVLSAVAALIFDIRTVFAHLQNPETGEFMIGGLADVPWNTVGIVSLIGIALAGVLLLCRKKK